MIITISGKEGSGKSTLAKDLAKKLGYRYYSVGDFMSELAQQRGLSVLELQKLAEKDSSIDRALDDRQRKLNKEDSIVVDSRLGYHFLPESVKIFLTVDDLVAADRIYAQGRKDEKENINFEATFAALKKRRSSNIKRYQQYYGVNPYDNPYEEEQFDLVVNTTHLKPKDALKKVLGFLKKNRRLS
ncbi:cytidylate kinase family protein [Candidatus Woesearchaeota archaeon]|nr:cytidylate kinase family protein [Candidatus Woesearchaeota archaeon]